MTDTIIKQIESNPFYQQILSDSFGGVMYDVANRNKYDEGKKALLALWDQIEYKEDCDGIIKGAMFFLQGN